MMPIQDHLGRQIALDHAPQRIISLCPSITETLFALGLEERIVGRTRFCIHPKDKVGKVHRVGGTKEIKFDRLHQLKPDLIIAEKEENTPEMVAELDRDYPVFVVNVEGIDEGLKMIEDLGKITGTRTKAKELLNEIALSKSQLNKESQGIKVAYFIWKDPYMGIGRQTYIQAMMEALSWENVMLDLKGRYPVVQLDQMKELNPDWVLLSSEPYPFKENHLEEFRNLFPSARVKLVDGEMFSWYGARMVQAFPYLGKLNKELARK